MLTRQANRIDSATLKLIRDAWRLATVLRFPLVERSPTIAVQVRPPSSVKGWPGPSIAKLGKFKHNIAVDLARPGPTLTPEQAQ